MRTFVAQCGHCRGPYSRSSGLHNRLRPRYHGGVDVIDSNATPECRALRDHLGPPGVGVAGLAVMMLVTLGAPLHGVAAPVPSGPEAPEAPATPSPPGLLRVKVDSTIDDAGLISEWIAARNPGLAERVPTFEGHDQWITVEILGHTYDYQIVVTAMRDGTAMGSVVGPIRCECNNEKLLELVDAQLVLAVDQLQIPPEEPAPDLEPVPPDTGEPAVPSPEPPPGPRERRVSRLGIAGIVTGSMGVAGVAGGVTMLMLGEQPRSNMHSLRGNWKEVPGVVSLAAGGAAVAAGVAMLLVDVIQCRNAERPRRCTQRGPRLEMGPSLQANGGGITVKGRF